LNIKNYHNAFSSHRHKLTETKLTIMPEFLNADYSYETPCTFNTSSLLARRNVLCSVIQCPE